MTAAAMTAAAMTAAAMTAAAMTATTATSMITDRGDCVANIGLRCVNVPLAP